MIPLYVSSGKGADHTNFPRHFYVLAGHISKHTREIRTLPFMRR